MSDYLVRNTRARAVVEAQAGNTLTAHYLKLAGEELEHLETVKRTQAREIDRLRTVLGFYADQGHWTPAHQTELSQATVDGGARARAVLETYSGGFRAIPTETAR